MDSGCVGDQPQRVTSSEAFEIEWPLRLVPLRGTQPLSGEPTTFGHSFIEIALRRRHEQHVGIFRGVVNHLAACETRALQFVLQFRQRAEMQAVARPVQADFRRENFPEPRVAMALT